MSPPLGNLYARWRTPADPGTALRDEDPAPPERLLQAIWCHQRLRRDRLQTADGRPLRVLHPGFVSVEGGPDFRGAVIQIGGAAPQTGDVEVDLRASGWRAHGHDRNPAFGNVLLHVVWDDAAPGPGTPTVLPLRHSLDAPLPELAVWLEPISLRALPETLRGQCCSALRSLEESRQDELLDAAARVRFQAKAEQFRARARLAGWEQAFWEGMFRALGYKHNVWPMQTLAEARPHWLSGPRAAFVLQARLFGLSGLLPTECPRALSAGAVYLRRLWDCWWRERDEFREDLLPRAAWRFHGLRPANHPQRRLALAAHWLADDCLLQQLEGWAAAEISDRKLLDSLRDILEVERDDFWSWHWTWRSNRLPAPQPMLGSARVTDLAVNVILPWLWTRAGAGGNEKIRQVIEQRYAAWPRAEDNALLKLARQRLLGVGRSGALRRAAAQQGLIQILRDFCEHSNALCERCRFPELVRGWTARPAT
ncbi:MAG TPA: DUF2851 family protein [Candidatus Acidoferrum sp.]|nr:DUF2851 family protein [Candidatus Acidoferrum sp.]